MVRLQLDPLAIPLCRLWMIRHDVSPTVMICHPLMGGGSRSKKISLVDRLVSSRDSVAVTHNRVKQGLEVEAIARAGDQWYACDLTRECAEAQAPGEGPG